jgi:hypothetical protein
LNIVLDFLFCREEYWRYQPHVLKEADMAHFPRLERLTLFAAILFATLAIPFSSRAQAPLSQQRGIGQSVVQPTKPVDANAEEYLFRYLTNMRYLYFIEFVGRENDHIQKVTRPGMSPIIERTDYTANIGISDSEEQVMLEIVLQASPQIIDSWDEIDAEVAKVMQQNGDVSSVFETAEVKAQYAKMEAIVVETRNNLKQEIGDEFLKKLDEYVFRDFINRLGPVSRLQRSPSRATQTPSQRPELGESAVNATQTNAITYADRMALDEYFQIAGASFKKNMQQGSEDKDIQESSVHIYVPADKRQAVIAVVLESKGQIEKNAWVEFAAIGEYHKQSGPQPIPSPLPAEFAALINKHWQIVLDNVAKLKQILGEEEYRKFDKSVNQVFGEQEISAGQDSAVSLSGQSHNSR